LGLVGPLTKKYSGSDNPLCITFWERTNRVDTGRLTSTVALIEWPRWCEEIYLRYLCQLRRNGYPAVPYFDETVALELAHHLRHGLPGGDDHVRQILVGEAYL
jgi:hypothetical protein